MLLKKIDASFNICNAESTVYDKQSEGNQNAAYNIILTTKIIHGETITITVSKRSSENKNIL